MSTKTIYNVSFIIIAKNEEKVIDKCLLSIERLKLVGCEVICIDSGSSDNTLIRIRNYGERIKNFKVYAITGYSNSAIARNVGIKHAAKKYIYFVDGDVEISEEFIYAALNKIEDGYDAVTGNLVEYQYDAGYGRIVKKINTRANILKDHLAYVTGGTFFIRSDIIRVAGLFDEKFERSQDIEFSLRLTRKYKMVAITQNMGIHHTIPYHDLTRIAKGIYRFHPAYLGMAVRKNITNYKGVFELFTGISGILYGLLIAVGFLVLGITVNFKFAFGCMFIMLALDAIYGLSKKKNLGFRIISHYVYPFFFLLGLLVDIDLRKQFIVKEVIN